MRKYPDGDDDDAFLPTRCSKEETTTTIKTTEKTTPREFVLARASKSFSPSSRPSPSPSRRRPSSRKKIWKKTFAGVFREKKKCRESVDVLLLLLLLLLLYDDDDDV